MDFGNLILPCGTDELPFGSLSDELLGGHLVAIEDSAYIDIEYLVYILLGQIQDRLYLCDAGIGHHDRQGS